MKNDAPLKLVHFMTPRPENAGLGSFPVDDDVDTEKILIYSISEMANLTAPDALVEMMLPERGVSIIAGQSGVMKSFLMIEVGLNIALGTNINEIKVKQTGVVIMINEGQSGIGQRCQAALNHHKREEPDNFRIIPMTPSLMDDGSLDAFIDAIKELPFIPGLLIIDTFNKATIGGDDNSTKDMALAIDTAEKLGRRFDAAIVLIDHVGKDRTKGVRGSYAKQANAVMVALVTKSGDNVKLKTIKQKEAEDNIEFNFKINLSKVTSPDTGEVREVPALSHRPEQVFPSHKDFIIQSLEERGRIDRDELLKSFISLFTEKSKDSFKTALARLRKDKKIKETDGYVQLID